MTASTIRFTCLAALLFVLASCGSTSNSPPADVLTDLARSDQTSDIAGDAAPDAADATPDAGDATPDAASPTPEFVFEVRQHQGAVSDAPFAQDAARLVRNLDQAQVPNVLHVALTDDGTWAANDKGEIFLEKTAGEGFLKVADGLMGEVSCLCADWPNGLLVCSGPLVYSLAPDGLPGASIELGGPALDTFFCNQQQVILYAGSVCIQSSGTCQDLSTGTIGTVLSGACLSNTLYLGTETGLWRRADDSFTLAWTPPDAEPIVALAAAADTLAAASLSTVVLLHSDGTVAATHSALDATLPAAGNTSVALDPTGSRWAVGHAIGLSSGNVDTTPVEHFHSLRYLPGERVSDVALPAADTLIAATSQGVSFLTRQTTTLAQKAEDLFNYLNDHHWRLGGFVSPHAVTDDPWNPTTLSLADDDNDGQWTQEAVGAFCFAYATTHDTRYLDAARKAVGNMFLLQDVPAIDFAQTSMGPGFISRSVVRDDEGLIFQEKATQSNWHLVHYTDGHDYYWKDDTSSDETTGHFFGWPIYYDLCAQDDQERDLVASHIVALADTILNQGYTLVDLDGEPTLHGYWQPERLAIAVDGLKACVDNGHTLDECGDAYFGGAYLNSAEILGAMLAAWHVSGQQRFLSAYESLVSDFRYDELATFSEYVMTWTQPGIANYCDHELADLAFLTLLRYEPNPQRRQLWVAAIHDAFAYEAEERNPLKSLALAAVMDTVPGLAQGVRTLQEYPSDMRMFLVDNSHRTDVKLGPDDRHGDPQFTTVLPYDEIALRRWDGNPYAVADGGDGTRILAPTFWLLPYWGLRYYGAITD